MCKLDKKYNKKEFVGWKVVAIKDGSFISPAMGCKYPMKGAVPVVTKQKRTSDFFSSKILCKNIGYRNPNMIGRTAVFKRKKDADLLANKIFSAEIFNFTSTRYQHVVVKAKVSKELMQGSYGEPVMQTVAGRHIEFMPTPQQVKQFSIKIGK